MSDLAELIDEVVLDAGQASPTVLDRHSHSLVGWGDMWADDHVAEDFLVAPLIARGRAHALFAVAKTGKSLLALEVAAAAATGRPVLGHPGGDPIRVLYVDAEMTRADLRERLTAMGYSPDDDLSALTYYSLPSLAPLDTPEGGAELVALAEAHGADLVVIDTVSRVLRGEENSADTIRGYYRHCGAPLKQRGMAVLRLDHAGKDSGKGARGSSAKTDDVDVVWEMVAREGGVVLRSTHQRMGWVPAEVSLVRRANPLRHEIVSRVDPAGTEELVALLDDLEVPVDLGRDKVRSMLQDAGEKAPRNDVIGAAIRVRRGGR